MAANQDELYRAIADVVSLEKESRKTLTKAIKLQEALYADSKNIMEDILRATHERKDALLGEMDILFSDAQSRLDLKIRELNNSIRLMSTKGRNLYESIGERFARISNLLILFLGAAFLLGMLGAWSFYQVVMKNFDTVAWTAGGVVGFLVLVRLFFYFKN